MKKSLLILIPLTLLILLIPLVRPSYPKTLKIGATKISVKLADTTESQVKGLSGQSSLEKNSGMFFKFPGSAIRTMWMKDMNFPLDVVWIEKGSVVEITKNIVPLGDGQPVVSSKENADSFLELNAGFADLKK